MKQLLAVIFLVIFQWSSGQISFYKQFSNNGYDYGQGVVQLEDSSYVITGSSSSFLDAPSQMFLLKIDSMGNFIWSKSYGGNQIDWGRRVMYIENDGFLVAGYTNSAGEGAYDFALWKTDENGNEQWFETYGTQSWDRVLDAALTRDSGVILVGETLNTYDGLSDILIVRTDKFGTELWREQIGGQGIDVANAIEQFNDSSFVVVGSVFVADSSRSKGYILKLVDDGNHIDADTLGLNGDYVLNDVEFILNEFNVVGSNKLDGYNHNYFAKINIDGTVVFQLTEVLEGDHSMVGISHYGDLNDFLFVCSSNDQYSFGGYDIDIFNFAYPLYFSGIQAEVSYEEDDSFSEIVRTNDNGAVLIGNVSNPQTLGGSNIFVMKIGNGTPYFSSNDDFSTEPLVGLNENFIGSSFKLFPNPAYNVAIIQTEDDSEKLCRITDMLGKKILETYFNEELKIDVSNMTPGSYFVTVEGSNSKDMLNTVLLIVD